MQNTNDILLLKISRKKSIRVHIFYPVMALIILGLPWIDTPHLPLTLILCLLIVSILYILIKSFRLEDGKTGLAIGTTGISYYQRKEMIVPWNEIEMIARANLTRIPEYEYLGIRLSNPKKFSEIMPKFTRIQDKFHLGCMTSELDGSLNDICAHIRALQNAEKISVVFKE